jgi:hypothetical protein
VIQFLSGGIFMGYVACCFFFMRAYRQTLDPLFRWFAYAMALLALERVALAVLHVAREAQPAVYFLRLCAHLLIIVAIFRKNAARR